MKRQVLTGVLTFVFAFSIFNSSNKEATALQEKSIVWKFANFGTSGSPWNGLPAWFFNEIDQRSNGRLKVKMFLGESLVPTQQAPESLKAGICQSTAFLPIYYHSKLPLGGFITYPFVLPGSGSKEGVRDTFLIADKYFTHPLITKELEAWDAMYIVPHGFNQYEIAGNKPVYNVNDFKGVRIRITGPSAPVLRKFGAAPVYISTGEAYEGLQKGTVDLFAHSSYFFNRYKIFEVCKFFIEDIQMGTSIGPFVIKLSAFRALPKDIQAIILDVKKEALNKFWTTYYDEEALGRKAARDKGLKIINFPKEERAKLLEAAKELAWPEWIEKTKALGLPAQEISNWLLGEIKAMGW